MVVTSSRLEAVRYKLAFENMCKRRVTPTLTPWWRFREVNDPDLPDHPLLKII